MGFKLGQTKFQPSTPRGTFLDWGLNEGSRKNVRFPMEKVTINHQ